MARTRAWVEHQEFNRNVAVFVLDESEQGRWVAEPLTMKRIDDDAVDASQPTFRLKQEEAQLLMDDLWRLGFRPSEGSGSAGSLAATERHLADMRALVFRGKVEPVTGPRR